jgi:hypothetical protein
MTLLPKVKPISAVAAIVGTLLVVTIGALVVGQLNADERLLRFSRNTLVGVLVISCLPFVGLVVVACIGWLRRIVADEPPPGRASPRADERKE